MVAKDHGLGAWEDMYSKMVLILAGPPDSKQMDRNNDQVGYDLLRLNNKKFVITLSKDVMNIVEHTEVLCLSL